MSNKQNKKSFLTYLGNTISLFLLFLGIFIMMKGLWYGFLLLLGAGINVFITYFIKIKLESKATVKTKNFTTTLKPKSIKSTPKRNLILPTENSKIKLETINQEEKIELNIFGEIRKISVSSQRILYDESLENHGDGTPLNEREIEEVNWLISSNVINKEKTKKLILKYINEVYQMWEDEWTPTSHKSILPPEVEINEIVIADIEDDYSVIAFCGECACDSEHGFSISFVNRKTMECGAFMDFEQVGSDYMLRENID